ncbi:nicotinamide riboside transporter PnuC [Rheinheimera maricola]|uniref:Nicotinamide riboside transporter PnuC n=1 Tax=Rheinheimera maricola TaxID=2793282 RepID=A0ABS7X552_9GAMM|nr:nicotinamide riboside transporter PnuC [Rheinheimera maricola]MBZ9610672.1 nicotinamide riboside transporter PnuC [Rheinheimera maricola]
MLLWQDLKRLNQYERYWLQLFLLLIIFSTCWFSYSGTDWQSWQSIALNWLLSPVSAISGVLCVVMVAKGLLSNWIWGLISAGSYGFIAWTSGYYGDWLLNWGYFLPAQLFIYYSWRHQLNSETQIVRMRCLGKHWLWVLALILLGVWLLAQVLAGFDGFISDAFKRNSAVYGSLQQLTGLSLSGPVLDASTVVLQISAQLLMIRMFAAQWPLWIANNVFTIFAWSLVLLTEPASAPYAVPTLLMWIAFLLNSIYGALSWYRGAKAN